MDGEPTTEVSFFHLSSRLNRLRYFSYSLAMGWVSAPLSLLSVYLTLHQERIFGYLLTLVAEIFIAPIQFTFLIRRLHDMGQSGWWSLIYAASLPFFLLVGFGIKTPGVIAIVMLLGLADVVFLLVVLFSPGTPGENKFGYAPPPNGDRRSGLGLVSATVISDLFVFYNSN